MSAGLPGLGLGGLFFILSALVAPFFELARTVQGRSSRAAWAAVGRQFAIAVAMIVAVDLTIRFAYALLTVTDLGDTPSPGAATVLPLLPIGITAALLAIVVATAKGMQLVSRLGPAPLTMPLTWPSRPRILAGAGTLVAAWCALLFVGASQLSTLSSGEEGRADDAPVERAPSAGDGPVTGGSPTATAESALQTVDREPAGERGFGPRSAGQVPNGASPGAELDLASSAPVIGSAATGVSPGPAAPAGAGSPFANSQAPDEPPGQAQAGTGGNPSESTGPPESAGPPAQSQAPDSAGPAESAGPPAHAGVRQPSVR